MKKINNIYHRRLLMHMGLAIAFSFMFRSESFGQLVTVQEMNWTDSIKSGGTYNKVYENRINTKTVYFWIKSTCDSIAFREIRNAGRPPVGYKWFYKTGLTWHFDTMSQPDSLPPSRDRIDSLHNQLKSGRHIEWTSWSQMPHLTRGLWKVSVVLLQDNTILKESKIKVE